MKNKVIEVIDEMIIENKKSSDYMTDKLAGPVRDNLIKEAKSRIQSLPDDDWIAVTDRLPYEGETVLVTGDITQGILLYSEGVGFPGYIRYWHRYPTLPLPLPPK